jgi:hypothetical protein
VNWAPMVGALETQQNFPSPAPLTGSGCLKTNDPYTEPKPSISPEGAVGHLNWNKEQQWCSTPSTKTEELKRIRVATAKVEFPLSEEVRSVAEHSDIIGEDRTRNFV